MLMYLVLSGIISRGWLFSMDLEILFQALVSLQHALPLTMEIDVIDLFITINS